MVCSKTTFDRDGSHNATHAFDTGAAWQNLALEGARRGLVVHAMAGFDEAKAVRELNVPDEYAVHAMVAIGVHAPEEAPESERPNGRKQLDGIVTEGGFR